MEVVELLFREHYADSDTLMGFMHPSVVKKPRMQHHGTEFTRTVILNEPQAEGAYGLINGNYVQVTGPPLEALYSSIENTFKQHSQFKEFFSLLSRHHVPPMTVREVVGDDCWSSLAEEHRLFAEIWPRDFANAALGQFEKQWDIKREAEHARSVLPKLQNRFKSASIEELEFKDKYKSELTRLERQTNTAGNELHQYERLASRDVYRY